MVLTNVLQCKCYFLFMYWYLLVPVLYRIWILLPPLREFNLWSLCSSPFWPPVQKLHDHHGVLWKKPIWRGWGLWCFHIQNSDFSHIQPSGPCLTGPPRPTTFDVPSVPAHLGTRPRQAALLYWPILLTYLSMCLHCPGTTTLSVGLTISRVSMCIFNPFNHGKCSAGLTV